MDKTVTAGLILENSKKEILVMLRKMEFPEGSKWGLVGGMVDGEHVAEGLAIKIRQEIGFNVDPKELKRIRVFNWDDPKVIFHLFKLEVGKEIAIVLNTEGHDNFRWVSPERLYKELPLMKGLYKIIEEIYL